MLRLEERLVKGDLSVRIIPEDETNKQVRKMKVWLTMPATQKNMIVRLNREAEDSVDKTLQRLAAKLKTEDAILLKDQQGEIVATTDSSNLTNEQAFQPHYQLCLGDEYKFIVRMNVPSIERLSLHSYPMVGCPLLPQVELYNSEPELCQWHWFRCPAGKPFAQVGELVGRDWCYWPQLADQGYMLVVVCTPFSLEGVEGASAACTPPALLKGGKKKKSPLAMAEEIDADMVVLHARLPELRIDSVTAAAADALSHQRNEQNQEHEPDQSQIQAEVEENKKPNDQSVLAQAAAQATLAVLHGEPVAAAARRDYLDSVVVPEVVAQDVAEQTQGGRLRVMTYNILLDAFCDSDFALKNLYPYLPHKYAHREYRQQLILRDILAFQPNVVCLQEVGGPLYTHYFHPQLTYHGYECHYVNKMSVQAFGGAIAVRRSTVELLNHQPLDLTKEWQGLPHVDELLVQPDMSSKLSRTTTRSQILKVRHRGNGGEAAIASLHLFSNPHAPNVRMIQAATATMVLQREYGLQTPVILCGDFNARSDAGVHEFLRNGKVDREHLEWLEGYLFNSRHTESQDEREDGWHKSLTWEDVLMVRQIFCALDPENTGHCSRQALFSLFTPEQAAVYFPATLTKDLLTYNDVFYWFRVAKQTLDYEHQPPLYAGLQQGIKAAVEAGHVVANPSLCRPKASAPPDAVYAYTELTHAYELQEAFPGVEFTYFAGLHAAPGILDYMYFSKSNLQCIHTFSLPSRELVTEYTAIPSVQFPSDHLPLVADFVLPTPDDTLAEIPKKENL